MAPRTTSLLVLFGALAALLLLAPDVLLIVFAGVLLAVLLRGGGHWIAQKLGIADGVGIGLFLLGVIAAFAVFGLAVAPSIADQIDELSQRLPEAFDTVRQRIAEYSWGPGLLDHLIPENFASPEGRTAAVSAVSSTFGALGNAVVILFIGLYGALDPGVYRSGFVKLIAPSIRGQGDEVLSKVAATLRSWLTAQLMAMAVVGVLTGTGLWIAGVPLAFALGLIAGLLAFIPNIGPVLAIAPALLLALPEGQTTVLIVLGIYVGVQALESYVVTPLLQQEKVSLPPALVIAVQLLFGVLFGILGLALATPITAAAMTVIGLVYVNSYLDREKDAQHGGGDR